MSLTDEEKQRIYEEEKARLEAQDRARADFEREKQSKSFKMEPVSLNKKAGGAGSLLLILLLVVGGAFYLFGGPRGATLDQQLGAVDTVAGGNLTLAKYNQIQTGMSYSEVCQILGESGHEQSRTEIMGITTVMYGWQNPSGANMTAMFQNDKLNTKAQFGLN